LLRCCFIDVIYNDNAAIENMSPELQQLFSPEVQAFYQKMTSMGGKARSLSKSLAAKRSAPRRWRLRRARYGESGIKNTRPIGHLSLRRERAAAKAAQTAAIEVEPERFSSIAFGEKEGDIAKAYSTENPSKPKTFEHDGKLFTQFSMPGNFFRSEATAHELIPAAQYKGPEQKGRAHEGRAVTYKGKQYRLGPQVTFASRLDPEKLKAQFRRMYDKGGLFASEAGSYHGMLKGFLEKECDIPEVVKSVIDAELKTPDYTRESEKPKAAGETKPPQAAQVSPQISSQPSGQTAPAPVLAGCAAGADTTQANT